MASFGMDDGMDDGSFFDPAELELPINASPEDVRARNLKLLDKALGMGIGEVAHDVKAFVASKGVWEHLLEFVVRLRPDAEDTRPRDNSDVEAQKRSFTAMTWLCSTMPSEVIHNNLSDIVNKLFQMFDERSDGNFLHFKVILAFLLSDSLSSVLHIICSNNLFPKILHFLGYPGVPDICIELLVGRKDSQRGALQDHLSRRKQLHLLWDGLFDPGNDARARGTTELLHELLDRFVSVDSECEKLTNVFFTEMFKSGTFLQSCTQVVTNQKGTYTTFQQGQVINLMHKILIKSREELFQPFPWPYTASSRQHPNPLAAFAGPMHRQFQSHLAAICDSLEKTSTPSDDGVKFSAYHVPAPFSYVRLGLVQIVQELMLANTKETLDALPPVVFKRMTTWLFDYPFNNIFHANFTKMFSMAVHSNHVETMKCLFGKHKFVTRMIDHFTSKPDNDGCRGWILHYLNIIRLMGDTQDNDAYVKTYLRSHEGWGKFLPQLRAETTRQQKKHFYLNEKPSPLGMGAPPPTDPDFIKDANDEGIDLGSAFARSLGFQHQPAAEEPPSPSGKGKKKKKKKKKRNSAGEEESSDSHDDEVSSAAAALDTSDPLSEPRLESPDRDDSSKIPMLRRFDSPDHDSLDLSKLAFGDLTSLSIRVQEVSQQANTNTNTPLGVPSIPNLGKVAAAASSSDAGNRSSTAIDLSNISQMMAELSPRETSEEEKQRRQQLQQQRRDTPRFAQPGDSPREGHTKPPVAFGGHEEANDNETQKVHQDTPRFGGEDESEGKQELGEGAAAATHVDTPRYQEGEEAGAAGGEGAKKKKKKKKNKKKKKRTSAGSNTSEEEVNHQ